MLSSASIPARQVLELGSSGGHNAVYLKSRFAMPLVDLSEDMLTVSRHLNPDCAHHLGDMRTVRLGRTCDAVFVHDAVDYVITENDLRQAVLTAFVHCLPGGITLFVPDQTAETFEATSDHGGTDGTNGRGARYLEWTWDPDPTDTWTLTECAFLLRHADGVVHWTRVRLPRSGSRRTAVPGPAAAATWRSPARLRSPAPPRSRPCGWAWWSAPE